MTYARIQAEIDAEGELAPPWDRFPAYNRTTIGWRMGFGETWMRAWHDWRAIHLADRDATRSYLRRHAPAPRTWADMVHYLLEGEWLDEIPEEVMDRLIHEGLVGDDVAFGAWIRRLAPSGAPPWGHLLQPEAPNRRRVWAPWKAARHERRGLTFWARWSRLDASGGMTALLAPPDGWGTFCVAALAGSFGDGEETAHWADRLAVDVSWPGSERGFERLAIELAATGGAPPAPWRLGLDASRGKLGPPREDTAYPDAWMAWVRQAFDDRPSFARYLRQQGEPPSDWVPHVLNIVVR